MLPAVKAAIKQNTHLIEREDWRNLYRKLRETHAANTIGGVSQALLDAGVNPLENSNELFPFFLAGLPIESYQIPEGIEIIGKYAFALCEDLREVIFPNTVKEIQDKAFLNDNHLEKIIFQGTADEWENIIKGSLWQAGTDNVIIKCLGGENID